MPSCELPAIRMTASEMFEIFGGPPPDDCVKVASLMNVSSQIQRFWPNALARVRRTESFSAEKPLPSQSTIEAFAVNSNPNMYIIVNEQLTPLELFAGFLGSSQIR